MPSTTITRGNVATTLLMQVTLTPVAVTSATSAEQNFSVAGVLSGDQISAFNYQGAVTGLVSIVNMRVVSSGVIGVSYANGTAGSLTPPSGTYLIELNRPESYPLPASAI